MPFYEETDVPLLACARIVADLGRELVRCWSNRVTLVRRSWGKSARLSGRLEVSATSTTNLNHRLAGQRHFEN